MNIEHPEQRNSLMLNQERCSDKVSFSEWFGLWGLYYGLFLRLGSRFSVPFFKNAGAAFVQPLLPESMVISWGISTLSSKVETETSTSATLAVGNSKVVTWADLIDDPSEMAARAPALFCLELGMLGLEASRFRVWCFKMVQA